MNKALIPSLFTAATLVVLSTSDATAQVAEPGVQRAIAASSSMQNLRDEMARLKKQTADTLAILNGFKQNHVDLQGQLSVYADQVAAMERLARQEQFEADQMKAKGRTYFEAWEKDIATISNPDIRAKAEKRRDQRTKLYHRIDKAMQEAKPSLDPFLSDLNDIKTFLGNDLTAAGRDSAKSLISRANSEGATVERRLQKVIAELDKVSADFEPKLTVSQNER